MTPSGRLDGEAVARVLGGGLLIATGADHFDLYVTGYRFVPTIGALFIVQVVLAFGLGLALLGMAVASETARRRAVGILSWQQVVSGLGAVLTIGTLALYLSSLVFGIFGFKDVRTPAGILAATLEITTFVLLSRVASAGLRPEIPAAAVRGVLAAATVVLCLLAETTAVPAAESAASQASSVSRVAASTPVLSMSQPGDQAATAANGKVVLVVVKNFVFHPDMPIARPGEELLIKNEDSVGHTFSTSPGAAAADSFSSGLIPANGSREVRAPERPGSYQFLCLIHQFMTGTLIVRSPG